MKKRNYTRPVVHALTPNEIIRKSDAGPYFGVRTTQLEERIKKGEIPKPMKLSKSGRAVGWLGKTILDWQRKLSEGGNDDRTN